MQSIVKKVARLGPIRSGAYTAKAAETPSELVDFQYLTTHLSLMSDEMCSQIFEVYNCIYICPT